MNVIEAIILGIVQGATEFLPVSSSGHLVLVSWWLGLDSPPLIYTVIVHVGTTAAILLYFWKDWWTLLQAGLEAIRTRSFKPNQNPHLCLLLLLILGTIPAGLIGLMLADLLEEAFSTPAIVSVNLFLTAGLLWFGEWATRRNQHQVAMPHASANNPATDAAAKNIGPFDSLIIGFAQALAIMPGISRSGSTIAAGMAIGLDRHAATRFSFLLATPIIIAAGLKQALDVLTSNIQLADGMGLALAVGFVVSAGIGYLCIVLLLKLVRRYGFYGFASYCVAFGLVSLGGVLLRG